MGRTAYTTSRTDIGAGLLGLLGYRWPPSPALAPIWPARIVTLSVAILLGPWYGIAATLAGVWPIDAAPRPRDRSASPKRRIGLFARRHRSVLASGAIFWVANGLLFAMRPSLYGVAYPARSRLAVRAADHAGPGWCRWSWLTC